MAVDLVEQIINSIVINSFINERLKENKVKANDKDRKTEVKEIEQADNEEKNQNRIECDIRYFDFEGLVKFTGHFDMIIVDPPYKEDNLESIQQEIGEDEQSPVKIDIQDVINLRIESLSKNGFIFLWILNKYMSFGYDCLQKWGYEVVDQIIWVKLRNNKMDLKTHNSFFMNSF